MSDPVKNVEIEDVLSSIRKLVSENTRAFKADPAHTVPVEKLVLTPSLRVEDIEDGVAEAVPANLSDANPPEAEDSWTTEDTIDAVAAEAQSDGLELDELASTLPHEDPLQSSEAVVQSTDFEFTHAQEDGDVPKEDGDGPQEVEDSVLDAAPVASFNAADDEAAAIDVFDADEADLAPNPETEADDAFFLEAEPENSQIETVFEAEQPEDVLHLSADSPLELAQDDPEVKEASELFEQPVEAVTDDYDEDEQDDIQAPLSFGDNNFDPEDSLPKDDWEDVQEDATPPRFASIDNTIPFVGQSFADRAEAQAEEDDTDEEDSETDMVSEVSRFDESILDEETLRDLVSELVREELQGVLGERITRNVRKLVRREIHRALASLELE
ncbi:hypothetical protein [Algirhabdus cladophorae]|uniref:hypothetical protein n=1 Tax=Algirhabdus cladophorae TaxID=3377108 RepID=UPI003B84A431